MDEDKLYSEAIAVAKSYADAILLKPLSEFGGILSDTVGYWRLKNQVHLMLKAKKWLEDRGVEPTRIRPDVFVPLMDNGGNVEDETLADMFAALLASHLDAERQGRVHPSFSYVLSQLSAFDAKLMIEFRKGASDPEYRELGLRGNAKVVGEIATEMDCSERAAFLSATNLQRLGVIERLGYKAPDKHPYPPLFEDSQKHQEYRITEYGIAFCDECCGVEDDSILHYLTPDSVKEKPA